MIRAENKLVQYARAREQGIPVPRTIVASNPADIGDEFDERVVVKPLGVGDFLVGGIPHAVHATEVSRDDPVLSGLAEAPFLIQRLVRATAHLRVVTVASQSWTARLDATAVPLDWRQSELAHAAWEANPDAVVEHQATRLASALGVRYTSQDWIIDGSGLAWFVDANPAGQWLFLPGEIAEAVTRAIAEALVTGDARDEP
jgi:hypothetical protein